MRTCGTLHVSRGLSEMYHVSVDAPGASPCLTPLASLVGAELARPLCFVSRHPFRRVLLGKAIVFGESLAAVKATLENHNLLPE